MSVAYVDTSAFLAAALGDSGGGQVASRLGMHSSLVSSNLLEAEVRSAFHRDDVEFNLEILSGIEWIMPERRLSQEFEAVLSVGYLRGADLWHVATALYVAPDPGEIAFITLDDRQRAVVLALGFQT